MFLQYHFKNVILPINRLVPVHNIDNRFARSECHIGTKRIPFRSSPQ